MSEGVRSHRARSLSHVRVSEAMTHGVITCPPRASLRTVARIMSTSQIHAIVLDGPRERPARAVSERELLEAVVADATVRNAEDAATSELPTVRPDEPLARAVEVMVERRASHVLVVDDLGAPAGILSALDVAAVIAAAGEETLP